MEVAFRVKCPYCFTDVGVDTNGKYKEGLNVRETVCPACDNEFSVVSFIESVKDITHSDEEMGVMRSKLRRMKLKRVRDVEKLRNRLDNEKGMG